jgi:plasmid maintenance system antidote protein VapI
MKCGPMRISEIISGKRQITPLTAIGLAKLLGTIPMFWMVLQCGMISRRLR